MIAFPLVTGISVVIMRMSVLLPAPFGPSKPKISPSATSKVMPPTASKSPYRLTMFSTAMRRRLTWLAGRGIHCITSLLFGI